jgi:4-hydroxy-2-oxoheptanedioate aldolase
MSEKSLRSIWKNGKAAVNGWMISPSAFCAEIMAASGYDAITIDMQHGLIGYRDMLDLLRAMAPSGVVPVVRLGQTDSAEIGKALDAGARALICPLVNDRMQAERLVSAAKYPPAGIRSFGPARAALARGPAAYFATADQDIAVLAMIETAQAMENLDEILAVEGLDGAYIGPADLGIGLGIGLPSDEPHEELVRAIEKIRAACAHHGKVAAVHAVPGISPRSFVEQGFGFVTTGADMEFLLAGSARAVAAAR